MINVITNANAELSDVRVAVISVQIDASTEVINIRLNQTLQKLLVSGVRIGDVGDMPDIVGVAAGGCRGQEGAGRFGTYGVE